MIQLIPAIDIIGGKCVRLVKGDYNQKTVYDSSPLDMAKRFEDCGFNRLHIVDLDGAKSKHIVNIDVLKAITENTGLIVDFGGGIKTEEDIRKAFENGASLVTVGSVSVTHRDLFLSWLDKFGADRMILGADVRRGKISINGWEEDTDEDIIPFLQFYIDKGVKNVLCTDISKDGMLQGVSLALYKNIMKCFPNINLIASGGVSGIDDIRNLNDAGIPSVVFGKSIYDGKIDITTLIRDIAQ
ncbi:MAG: 1-(5-phosphoribosyl)-5-[(5-phosphoribosylamino)methylideneamino]imidazole-4-carboxamide isomerase [Prevotella sp.]|nr:1-(5-phosphoribosyl)-5-[(5-phosphoribosylamino)methylideneamino]imidazole-4-carboxamide isomerase [Prevotella sp.]